MADKSFFCFVSLMLLSAGCTTPRTGNLATKPAPVAGNDSAPVGGVAIAAAAATDGEPGITSSDEQSVVISDSVSDSRVQLAANLVQEAAPSTAPPMHQHLPRPDRGTDGAIPGARQELQPGVGEDFMPPPDIPASPDALQALEQQPLEVGRPLTLEVLEELACANNPTLLQAQAQVQGTLGQAIQAGLWPNPTLVYSAEQIGVGGTPGEFQGGLIRQRIVAAHKLDLSRQKFLARTRVAEWQALAQQYRVLNDVRMHYFRARGRQDVRDVQIELLKNAEDSVVTVREMYNVGQAIRAEVHQANVVLQRQRLEVLMADNDHRQAREELISLVGVELDAGALQTPLEGDLTPIAWDDALGRLVAESPQMQAARAKLEADRITIKREIVEPVPDLVVEGGAGYNFDAKETTAAAMASIEVPLYDWNQGTIRQAEADYARQQGEIRRTELLLRRDLAMHYRNYLTALQHVQNYQAVILPESRRAYEILLDSYEDDRAPWTDVLDAERGYFTLRTEYIQNLIAWREAEVLIVGYLLHNGLDAPSQPVPPGHINAVPKPR